MHDEFADWYQSTNIDNNSESTWNNRWKGIKQVSDKLNYVADSKPRKNCILPVEMTKRRKVDLKEEFKKHDPGFLMNENDL